MGGKRILVLCTTDSMIYNFLIPHIRELVKNGYSVQCACSKTGAFFDLLVKQYGLEVVQINLERSPYRLENLHAYRALSRLVKEGKHDIIFCHEPVGGAMGRLVGHAHHCKVIYMAHGFHFYLGAPKSSTIYYLVEKYLSRYTDVLITINQEDYEAAQRFHAGKVVKFNGIGIDISRFRYQPDKRYLRNELGLSEDSVLLLSVGELIERKNHATMIRAMRYLPEKYHYLIAGEGELKNILIQLIQQEGVSGRVHLLGYRKDVSSICNGADVFVMPSFQEGLSVAVMEAMACGLPVVASRIRGNVDLIDDNKGGYLVEVSDPKQYTRAIQLMEDTELRTEFGAYNRKKLTNYDLSSAVEQMRKVFEVL